MKRTTWVGLTVSGIVVAGVAGAVALVGDEPSPEAVATASPAETVADAASPSPGTTPTDSSAPDAPVETLQEQVIRVAGLVEEVRGLTFDTLPEPVVLTPEELEARVREQLEEYEVADADLDSRLLAALGVVDPGTDVRQLLIDAYGEQVAGFYDPDTGELVVGSTAGGARLGRVDELTLAHELEHALADQALSLDLPDDVEDGLEDEAFARQALIEGDATVTTALYVEVGFTQADRLLLFGELDDVTAGLETDTLPYFLQRQLEFPYIEGANFVASLVQAAGWEAVDAAYADPPNSTAAILEPQRYVNGIDVDAPVARGQLDAPWDLVRTVDIGAADLLYLFEAPGGDTAAGLAESRRKALAWTGGTLDQWRDGDRDAFGFAFSGDGRVLCDALDAWYGAAFPTATRTSEGTAVSYAHTQQHATIRCGGVVRMGIGPDAETSFLASSVGDSLER